MGEVGGGALWVEEAGWERWGALWVEEAGWERWGGALRVEEAG